MASRWNIPAMLRFLVLPLLVSQLLPLASASTSSKKSYWLTLDGNAPKVVARGGFSGLFPDSSQYAYSVALSTSVSDVVLWCDVQLTKDGAGICFPGLTLDNSSSTANLNVAKKNSYTVNGVSTSGLFTIDYSLDQLANVTLIQGIFSRSPDFDTTGLPILTVESVFQLTLPTGFWLNIQHDQFFSQHKLDMQSFLLGIVKNGTPIDYLSSPEVAFLKGIAPKLKQTKVVFRFLQKHETEPTTKQTYDSLLKNLTFIKTFADGILVPKSYIWPFESLYLLPHTTLVNDAHGAGLEIFAADFANDNVLYYNYSYNPVAEYLNFVDNGEFSVDGVLSDFPITPSEAIDCFAHLGKNASVEEKILVISYNGASGDYPGCTDLAYTQAISDGADIIDCTIQLSKDGVPFCLSTINLMDSTTIAQTGFITLQQSILELQTKGIFSFSLTWKDIQGLTPAISNIYSTYFLYRNPKNKNAGKLVSLVDFLGIAKNSTTSPGVTVIIENAAYLAQKQDLSVTKAVLKALNDAGYTNQTANKVMIQSTDSSVLEAFKGKGYQLVYELDQVIGDVQNSTLTEIKSFADAVVVRKKSIYPDAGSYITGQTKVVDKFHAFKLKVFAQVFRNEFVSQDWDFFSDPIVEINSFVVGASVDGIITDFPQTAAAYRKNSCLNKGNNTAPYMLPIQPGSLLQVMSNQSLPPAQAPAEVLTDADVSEPPLPDVAPVASPSQTPVASPPKASSTSDGPRLIAALSSLAIVLIASSIFLS